MAVPVPMSFILILMFILFTANLGLDFIVFRGIGGASGGRHQSSGGISQFGRGSSSFIESDCFALFARPCPLTSGPIKRLAALESKAKQKVGPDFNIWTKYGQRHTSTEYLITCYRISPPIESPDRVNQKFNFFF
jgi:hypothetical protein